MFRTQKWTCIYFYVWTDAREIFDGRKQTVRKSIKGGITYMTLDLSLYVSGHERNLEELYTGKSTVSQTCMWCNMLT